MECYRSVTHDRFLSSHGEQWERSCGAATSPLSYQSLACRLRTKGRKKAIAGCPRRPFGSIPRYVPVNRFNRSSLLLVKHGARNLQGMSASYGM